MEQFSFNTAVARLMELLNALSKYESLEGKKHLQTFKDCFKILIQLLAPCAPHFSEEIWESLGNKGSVFNCSFPVCDEKALVLDEVEVAVQVNSKIKLKITIPSEIDEQGIRDIILSNEKLSSEIQGKEIKKLIIVPKRLINILLFSHFKPF